MAAKLSLSEQTVKNHLHNIFEKLGVSDRLELALLALEHGLVVLPNQPSADLAISSLLPIMKSILSVVPAPRKIRRVGKAWGRALPIEFVELSRTESYGY